MFSKRSNFDLNYPNEYGEGREKRNEFNSLINQLNLLRGIYNFHFKEPTNVQQFTIKQILMGNSIIIQSKLCSGKTSGFVIGILNQIETNENTTQALVIAPTYEIAEYIHYLFVNIGSKLNNLRVQLFSDKGNFKEKHQKQSSETPHIVISTPNKICELIFTNFLKYETLKIVCIDEADAIQNTKELEQIFAFLKKVKIQILLFSPSYPRDIFLSIKKYLLTNAIIKTYKDGQFLHHTVKQFYINVLETDKKLPTLIDLFGDLRIQKSIIFANSKTTVDDLKKELEKYLYAVSAIHEDMTRKNRDKALKDFREDKTRTLVTTDLLSRGIDFQNITLVINYEMPDIDHQYLYRISRSVGYGRKGIVINICDNEEMDKIQSLKSNYKIEIPEVPYDIKYIIRDSFYDYGL